MMLLGHLFTMRTLVTSLAFRTSSYKFSGARDARHDKRVRLGVAMIEVGMMMASRGGGGDIARGMMLIVTMMSEDGGGGASIGDPAGPPLFGAAHAQTSKTDSAPEARAGVANVADSATRSRADFKEGAPMSFSRDSAVVRPWDISPTADASLEPIAAPWQAKLTRVLSHPCGARVGSRAPTCRTRRQARVAIGPGCAHTHDFGASHGLFK